LNILVLEELKKGELSNIKNITCFKSIFGYDPYAYGLWAHKSWPSAFCFHEFICCSMVS